MLPVALLAAGIAAGCAGGSGGNRFPVAQAEANGSVDLDCLTGRYNGTATEIAAQLELNRDGRFRYILIYGALDEQAEGQWTADGGEVLLTSGPVTPPELRLIADEPSPDAQLHFSLDLPQGISRQYFDAELSYRDGTGEVVQFEEEGLAVSGVDPGQVAGVRVLLPLFGLASESHAFAGQGARSLRYRFAPNDLGKVAFSGKALAVEPGGLRLERYGRQLYLLRESGECERRR